MDRPCAERWPAVARPDNASGLCVRAFQNREMWYARDGIRRVHDFAAFDNTGQSGPPSPQSLVKQFNRPDGAAGSPVCFGRSLRRTISDVEETINGSVTQYTVVHSLSGGYHPHWVLRIGHQPGVLRALAGLVTLFAHGRPVPNDNTYPDVCAGPVNRDPLDVIAAIARRIGNDGIDYCLRTAAVVLRPDILLPDPDAWFIGIEYAQSDVWNLLWLGGPDPCIRKGCAVGRGYAVYNHYGVITEPTEFADALRPMF